jgi:CheY-like chemotaxis protein
MTHRSLRVIVVDDQVDFADTTGELIRQLGHEARVFHSADAMLTAVDSQKLEADVILADIGMPGMDGCELARQLRQRPGFKKVVLAAVTGFGEDSNTSQAGQTSLRRASSGNRPDENSPQAEPRNHRARRKSTNRPANRRISGTPRPPDRGSGPRQSRAGNHSARSPRCGTRNYRRCGLPFLTSPGLRVPLRRSSFPSAERGICLRPR